MGALTYSSWHIRPRMKLDKPDKSQAHGKERYTSKSWKHGNVLKNTWFVLRFAFVIEQFAVYCPCNSVQCTA
jgi:hypothetical protein